MVKITSKEQNKVKRKKDSLRDLWDEEVQEEEKKKGYEKVFEEIIVENFPNMEKEIVKSKKHKESHEGYTQGETGQDTY